MDIHYSVASILAVVDNNPEMADMSNPSGDVIGEVFFATATSDYGKVFHYREGHLDRDEAVADCIFAESLAINPEDATCFSFARYIYGSLAHRDNYVEAEAMLGD